LPNHFAALGFAVAGEADLARLAEHAAHEGELHPAHGGAYVRWSPGGGIELWLQVMIGAEAHDIVGLTPFFLGESRQLLGLVEAVPPPPEAPLEGGFRAIVNPHEEHLDGGAGLLFDVADAGRYHGLPLPVRAEVALAGFAHQLVAYPSEGAFRAAQPEFKLAIGRFDALSLPAEAPPGTPPLAEVRWTGQVLASELRENPFSGGHFVWARLKVPGCEVEIVADPELVESVSGEAGRLVPGGVVDGIFWVCGRIIRAL
jgi:hypothetical protein